MVGVEAIGGLSPTQATTSNGSLDPVNSVDEKDIVYVTKARVNGIIKWRVFAISVTSMPAFCGAS